MLINNERLRLLAKMFNGFSDLSRLKLLNLLKTRELSVKQLVQYSKLSQPNVSSHLKCLRDCNLVTSRRNGREIFYRISNQDITKLLNLADIILNTAISQLTACVNYEVGDTN